MVPLSRILNHVLEDIEISLRLLFLPEMKILIHLTGVSVYQSTKNFPLDILEEQKSLHFIIRVKLLLLFLQVLRFNNWTLERLSFIVSSYYVQRKNFLARITMNKRKVYIYRTNVYTQKGTVFLMLSNFSLYVFIQF